jgi:hypothetical protein
VTIGKDDLERRDASIESADDPHLSAGKSR